MKTTTCMFATSFSGEDQKKLARGALMGRMACCLMTFALCTVVVVLVFKPTYLICPPFPPVNLKQSISAAADLRILQTTQEIISRPPNQSFGLEDDDDAQRGRRSSSSSSLKPQLAIHNFTSSRSQVYELNGDVRIHGNSSTIFIMSSSSSAAPTANWITKPYARNVDKVAMRKVSGFQIQIINHQSQSHSHNPCARNFSFPAVLFSSGGYSGNPFHDFTDVLIPLYLTSRQFNGKVVFLVADKRSWWTSKYRLILEKLSHYDVVDIQSSGNGVVYCFPQVIVGLRAHKELSIDPSTPPYYSVRDFTDFLQSTYSLNRHQVHPSPRPRPRLLIVSRKKTRRLTNADQVGKLGRRLGFDVEVREMGWQVSRVAELVNSFDVMVGVHGAGLTNMLFLPANAVVIQIVPIGVEMLAKQFFQRPAKDMGLRYLEYRVRLNESSLSSSESSSSTQFAAQGWHSFRSVYLDGQDIKLDVHRFKETLSKALHLVLSAR